jgi:hypothetical protein
MNNLKFLNSNEMESTNGGWLKEIITAGFAYGVYLYDNRQKYVEGFLKGWNE